MATEPGKHATGAPTQPSPNEPAYADRVRLLLQHSRSGTLSTNSRRRPGFPFGSVMPYALGVDGRPIFLISTMAMHTQNLQADASASLFVQQAAADPLAAARVTLLGTAQPVPESNVAGVRELYLARHANSRQWVDYEDFSFYSLDIVDVYYIGGFGMMGWVPPAEYYGAQADPLADYAAGIIGHMNADHSGAVLQLSRKFANVTATQAVVTAVDRLGIEVRLTTGDGVRDVRIAFPHEVRTRDDAREVLVQMVQDSRQP